MKGWKILLLLPFVAVVVERAWTSTTVGKVPTYYSSQNRTGPVAGGGGRFGPPSSVSMRTPGGSASYGAESVNNAMSANRPQPLTAQKNPKSSPFQTEKQGKFDVCPLLVGQLKRSAQVKKVEEVGSVLDKMGADLKEKYKEGGQEVVTEVDGFVTNAKKKLTTEGQLENFASALETKAIEIIRKWCPNAEQFLSETGNGGKAATAFLTKPDDATCNSTMTTLGGVSCPEGASKEFVDYAKQLLR